MSLVSFVVIVAVFGSYASEPFIFPGPPILRNYVNQYPASFSGIPFPYAYASPYNYPQPQPLPPTQNVFFPIVINVPQVTVQTPNRGPKEEISFGYNQPLENIYSRQLMLPSYTGNNFNTQEGPLVQLMRLFVEASSVNSLESETEQSKFETQTAQDVSEGYQNLNKVEQVQSPSAIDETPLQMQRAQPENEVQPHFDKSQSEYTSYNVDGLDSSHGSGWDLKLLESDDEEHSQSEEDKPLVTDNSMENQFKFKFSLKMPLLELFERESNQFLETQEDTTKQEQELTLPEIPTSQEEDKSESQSDESLFPEGWDQFLHDITQATIFKNSKETEEDDFGFFLKV